MIAAYVTRWATVIGAAATLRKQEALAAWEALEAAEPPRESRPFAPGDLVRFTAETLRSMYGVNRLGFANWAPCVRFTVAPCACDLCALGHHLAVHEGRHIAKAALEHAQRSPAGPVRREDAEAALAELGLRVDDAGEYWLRPPC